MIPLFSGPNAKRNINLGGTSQQRTAADLLSEVAAERERRMEGKRRWEGAVGVQSWWRGRREAGVVRGEVGRMSGEGREVGGAGSIRALRCVVVASWGGKSKLGQQVLREWCQAVLRSGPGCIYSSIANDGDTKSWFVLMTRITQTMLESVGSAPESESSLDYLSFLDNLLAQDVAVSVLGQRGAQICQQMTQIIINNGLYVSMSQALKQIPIESKSSPALPYILSLITHPLSTSTSTTTTILSIFKHILTIPLLPNRLPLSSLPIITSRLPFTRLDTLNPYLFDAVDEMTVEEQIHFLANLNMFVGPGLKSMKSEGFVTYLEVCVRVINRIPGEVLEKKKEGEGKKGKGKKGKGDAREKGKGKGDAKKRVVEGSASEGSRPHTPLPSTTRVVVVEEFSEPARVMSGYKKIELDSKTQSRILKLGSRGHLEMVIEARQGKDYGRVLRVLVEYLFALSVMGGGLGAGAGGLRDRDREGLRDSLKDRDRDRPPAGGVVQFLAGGGAGGGFLREVWRECVRGSPLGREGDSGSALFDPQNTPHWPPLLLLADVYSQMMLTMGDDEFFGTDSSLNLDYGSGRTLASTQAPKSRIGGGSASTSHSYSSATPSSTAASTSSTRTRNPLSLDELKTLSKKLLNVAFGLYWIDRSVYTGVRNVFGMGVSWEDARERVRVCLCAIRDRDSRRRFVPKDHWLVKEMSMAGFVEAAVMEEQKLVNSAFEDTDPNAMDVDSPSHLSHPSHSSHSSHPHSSSTRTSSSNQRSIIANQKLSLLTPRLLILNNLPFAIPFEVRVEIFRHFIVFDAMRHNGGGRGMGMFGGGPGGAGMFGPGGIFGGGGGGGGGRSGIGGVAINPLQRFRQSIVPSSVLDVELGGGDEGGGGGGGSAPTQPNVGLGVNALGRSGRGRREKVMIRRDRVAQDGFDKLRDVDLKRSVEIGFVDRFGEEEAGIDGGGVFKEFFTSLCKEVFDTDRGLWLANKKNELYPNPHAYATEAHSLNWYRFIGRILGKALYEGILIDVAFASFFISKLLDKQSFLDDLESLDPELYNGLVFLKHYEGDVEGLGLWFGVDVDEFGVTKTIDLIPNGSNIAVTKENRLTYIVLMSHFRLSRQIKKQSEAFFEGLGEMIEGRWLKMFNQQEVQTLMGGVSGTPISIADLRQHTLYGGLYSDTHPTIVAFWNVVGSMTEEEKKGLLRFVTSCSRPPLLGFRELVPNFCVRDGGVDEGRLPTASTCVNLLKLPLYTNERILRQKLLQAINSNAGFDLS